jgi:hypothetical protein
MPPPPQLPLANTRPRHPQLRTPPLGLLLYHRNKYRDTAPRHPTRIANITANLIITSLVTDLIVVAERTRTRHVLAHVQALSPRAHKYPIREHTRTRLRPSRSQRQRTTVMELSCLLPFPNPGVGSPFPLTLCPKCNQNSFSMIQPNKRYTIMAVLNTRWVL